MPRTSAGVGAALAASTLAPAICCIMGGHAAALLWARVRLKLSGRGGGSATLVSWLAFSTCETEFRSEFCASSVAPLMLLAALRVEPKLPD